MKTYLIRLSMSACTAAVLSVTFVASAADLTSLDGTWNAEFKCGPVYPGIRNTKNYEGITHKTTVTVSGGIVSGQRAAVDRGVAVTETYDGKVEESGAVTFHVGGSGVDTNMTGNVEDGAIKASGAMLSGVASTGLSQRRPVRDCTITLTR